MRKLKYKKSDLTKKRKRLIAIAMSLVIITTVWNNAGRVLSRRDEPEVITQTIAGQEYKTTANNTNANSNEGQTPETNTQLDPSKPSDPIVPNTPGQDIERYGVSSSNPLASQLAMQVLEDGGNAVDAAVALSFALMVTDPQNSGIGGGGGMLVYDQNTQDKVFYDYYISSGDQEPVANIGIPGFLKGMERMSQDLGSMTLSQILDYVIAFADEGIVVTEAYSKVLKRYSYIGEIHPNVLREDGEFLQAGDIFRQADLVDTLKEIQLHGSDVMYGGTHPISQNFMQVTGISAQSLANYDVIVSDPLMTRYHDRTIFAPKGPFSGLTIIQNLELDKVFKYPQHDVKNPEYNEVMRLMLRFTASQGRHNIADPNFFTADYGSLINPSLLLENYRDFNEDEYYHEPETESTTAFSVIDKNGMVVSGTNTISNYWGSYQYFAGIIYNNAMKNFTSEPNDFQFNKRPKTGIAPVVIVGDDGSIESLGANGGAKIPSFLTSYLFNTIKFDLQPQQANDLERFYYLKRLMNYEKNAPLSSISEETDIVFEQPYVTLNTGNAWGVINGLRINADGSVQGHNDRRNYFEGGTVYINGDYHYPPLESENLVKNNQ